MTNPALDIQASVHVPLIAAGSHLVNATATFTTAEIDRRPTNDQDGYMSVAFLMKALAPSGSPTAYSIAIAIEESETSGSGFTAVTGGAFTTMTDATAASLREQQINLNLKPRSRYLRCTATISFTGGSSPAVVIALTPILGGARRRDAQ